jgi:hypothetical protein
MEPVPETLHLNELTRLKAQEDYIETVTDHQSIFLYFHTVRCCTNVDSVC